MKLKTNKLSAWLAALAFVVLAPMAQAAPLVLVVDGEFLLDPNFASTGTWSRDGTPVDIDSANRPSGTAGTGSAHFLYASGRGGFPNVLTQPVSGLNEQPFDIEFFLMYKDLSGFTAMLTDVFDNTAGSDQLSDVNLLTSLGDESVGFSAWVRYYGQLNGFADFTLSFSYTNPDLDKDFGIFLDGVSITQVPEPGSLALVGLALAGIAVVRRRKA